jgi:hypothetical protein
LSQAVVGVVQIMVVVQVVVGFAQTQGLLLLLGRLTPLPLVLEEQQAEVLLMGKMVIIQFLALLHLLVVVLEQTM